jgi:hypothetical protein
MINEVDWGPFKPYLGEEDELDSRTPQMQEWEDDEDISTINTSTPTQVQIRGPIARACACHHNYLVCSFLNSCPSHLEMETRALLFWLGIVETIRRTGDWRRLDSDCKPCTYLASKLALSPIELNQASTRASSPRSTIRCVQNDFSAYGTFSANLTPILR